MKWKKSWTTTLPYTATTSFFTAFTTTTTIPIFPFSSKFSYYY